MRKLIISKEDIEPQVSDDIDKIDVTEPSKQIVDITDATNDAMEDLNTLTRIHRALEDILNKDEEALPNEDTLTIANIATEHCYNSLGIKSKHSVLHAIESYSTVRERRVALKASLETIQEWIKKIWEAILKAFNSIWEWLKKFFTGLFTRLGLIKSKVADIKAKIENKEEMSTGNVEATAKFNVIAENGKVTVESTNKALDAIIKSMQKRESMIPVFIVDIKTALKEADDLNKGIEIEIVPLKTVLDKDNKSNEAKAEIITLEYHKPYINKISAILDTIEKEANKDVKIKERANSLLAFEKAITAALNKLKEANPEDNVKNTHEALKQKMMDILKIIKDISSHFDNSVSVMEKVVSYFEGFFNEKKQKD